MRSRWAMRERPRERRSAADKELEAMGVRALLRRAETMGAPHTAE